MYSKPNSTIEIQGKTIGENFPTYFIADVAANHDGNLQRAKDLIWLAADAGADAAKFQHFQAKTIVSDHGFLNLGGQQSHQSKWKKSVFEVYKDASIDLDWTYELKSTCDKAGISFFTSPYAFDLVDHIDPYVPAYKIGSGDITWIEIIKYVAGKNKPYILATGASNIDDIHRAVKAGLEINPKIALLQCNTNYTGRQENFKYINLNVLKSLRGMYPEMILGLSDHTPGHSTVLGAVALGARIVEKHLTDDNLREGPDHEFSMNPVSWREMVSRTRELESALGSGVKKIEDNEFTTVVLQRRCIRLVRSLSAGIRISKDDLQLLRPCPPEGLPPYRMQDLIGRELRFDKIEGDYLTENDFN